jgi:hypothetical protein
VSAYGPDLVLSPVDFRESALASTLDSLLAAEPLHGGRAPATGLDECHAGLRSQILTLLAAVSYQENWTLRRCATVARHVDIIPDADLEQVARYFIERRAGHLDGFADGLPENDAQPWRPCLISPVRTLHANLGALETRLTAAPAYISGIRGVRIMRLVALMSK